MVTMRMRYFVESHNVKKHDVGLKVNKRSFTPKSTILGDTVQKTQGYLYYGKY